MPIPPLIRVENNKLTNQNKNTKTTKPKTKPNKNMKLHYALAALAVAAMSFGGYAADDTGGTAGEQVNLVAGWNNYGNPNDGDKTPADFGWVILNADGTTDGIKSIGTFDSSYTTRFQSDCNGRNGGLFLHFQNSNAHHFAYPITGLEPNTSYVVSVDFYKNGNDGNNKQVNFGVNTSAANSGTQYYNEIHYPNYQDGWLNAQYIFTTGDVVEESMYVTFNRVNYSGGQTHHLPISNLSVTKLDYSNASSDNPVEVTCFIKNHSFDESDGFFGWTNNSMVKQANNSFGLKDGPVYVEKWTDGKNGTAHLTGSLGVRQTITLNKGSYKLTAVGQNLQQQNQPADPTGIWIYAGENQTSVKNADLYEVLFDVYQDNSAIEIGYKGQNPTGNYVTVDNFRLYYLGAPAAITMPLNVTVTDINGVAVEGASVKVGEKTATTNAEGKATIDLTSDEIENVVAEISLNGYYTKNVAVNYGAATEANVNIVLLKSGDNLMYNALEGESLNAPVNWKGYRRNGELRAENDGQLRDESGSMSGTGTPYQYFVRWDGGDFDRYFTYPIDIPETGIYEFSLSYTQNGSWNPTEGSNANSHVGAVNKLQVALTTQPGYRYNDTQVYYLNSEGNHTEFYTASMKFFAEAGTHYLSFVGSRALWSVKDMVFKLVDNSKTTLHEVENANVDGYIVEEIYRGGASVTPAENADVKYVFVKDGNSSIQLYAPLATRNFTENGTLYMFETVDGVNSKVKTQVFQFAAPELEEGHLLIDGVVNNDETVSGSESKTVTFITASPFAIYYKFEESAAQTPEGENALAEGDEHEGYTKYNAAFTVEKAGKLTYYPFYNGMKGAEKVVNFDIQSGVAVIGVEAAEAEYFTLEGVRVDGNDLTPGVYVVRRGTKAEKILVK